MNSKISLGFFAPKDMLKCKKGTIDSNTLFPKEKKELLVPNNHNASMEEKIRNCFSSAIKHLKACCLSKDPDSRACKTLCAFLCSAVCGNGIFAIYSPTNSMGDVFLIGIVSGGFGALLTGMIFTQEDEIATAIGNNV